ncbi:hypothetical protein GGF42_006275 [Coemansia sp. RSA 2424]|nr:hypothetical protein GGF42_006275 [Coemansia sp. RSA 2424]
MPEASPYSSDQEGGSVESSSSAFSSSNPTIQQCDITTRHSAIRRAILTHLAVSGALYLVQALFVSKYGATASTNPVLAYLLSPQVAKWLSALNWTLSITFFLGRWMMTGNSYMAYFAMIRAVSFEISVAEYAMKLVSELGGRSNFLFVLVGLPILAVVFTLQTRVEITKARFVALSVFASVVLGWLASLMFPLDDTMTLVQLGAMSLTYFTIFMSQLHDLMSKQSDSGRLAVKLMLASIYPMRHVLVKFFE